MHAGLGVHMQACQFLPPMELSPAVFMQLFLLKPGMSKGRKPCVAVSSEDLAAALGPHLDQHGAGFVQYGPMNSKLNVTYILGSKMLWRDIKEAVPNLLPKHLTVEQALQKLMQKLNMDFDNTQKATALRAQARAILQATKKSAGAPWLYELWQGSGSVDSMGQKQKQQEAEQDVEQETQKDTLEEQTHPALKQEQGQFYFGFDREHKAAWRAPADQPARKTFTKNFEYVGKSDDQPVVAVFLDGERHAIPQLLVCQVPPIM